MFENGLMVSHTIKTGHTTEYLYDALGRLTATISPRIGESHIGYYPNGMTAYEQDPSGLRTTFDYYPDGRLKSESVGGTVTRYAYNDRGQVTRVWGSAAKPSEYVYDGLGILLELRTFRDGNGFDGETWPAGNAKYFLTTENTKNSQRNTEILYPLFSVTLCENLCDLCGFFFQKL